MCDIIHILESPCGDRPFMAFLVKGPTSIINQVVIGMFPADSYHPAAAVLLACQISAANGYIGIPRKHSSGRNS